MNDALVCTVLHAEDQRFFIWVGQTDTFRDVHVVHRQRVLDSWLPAQSVCLADPFGLSMRQVHVVTSVTLR